MSDILGLGKGPKSTANNAGYTGMGSESALTSLADLAKRSNDQYMGIERNPDGTTTKTGGYVGFENDLINQAKSPLDLTRLRGALGDQRTMLSGIGARANERIGLSLDNDQTAANARRDNLMSLAGKSNALTQGAQSQFDTNQSLLGQMGTFGRGLQAQATNAMQTAAQMEQSREDQYAQAMDSYRNMKAQYNGSLWTGFGTW
jgi:hypothetical protein